MFGTIIQFRGHIKMSDYTTDQPESSILEVFHINNYRVNNSVQITGINDRASERMRTVAGNKR